MQKVTLVGVALYDFGNRELFLIVKFLAFSACQKSEAKKSDNSYFENSCTSSRTSFGKLMRELKHIYMEKSEFQQSNKIKPKFLYLQEFFRGIIKNCS